MHKFPVSDPSPLGETTQPTKDAPNIASGARSTAFIGDHRSPPPRPPSTGYEKMRVNSLSFADSIAAAFARRERTILETEGTSAKMSALSAPVCELQQVRRESFREVDALVTGCEIKIHMVNIARVRKLCRKAQRLRSKVFLIYIEITLGSDVVRQV